MRRFRCVILCASFLLFGCNKIQIKDNAHPIDHVFPEEFIPRGDVKEINLANGMTVYMDEDSVYFLGDILFSKRQIVDFDLSAKSAHAKGSMYYWPSNIIPYYIGAGFTSADILNIKGGLIMLQNAIDFDFVQCSSYQSDGINFNPSSGNSSPIGKQDGGNTINLASGGFISGTVAHEVMHSLGYFHEQSRTDRDSYVTINWDNIKSGKAHNFYTFSELGYQGFINSSYDYNSIMHYGSDSFQKEQGLLTITKKDGSRINPNRSYLTQKDIEGLYLLYGATPNLIRRSVGGYDETTEQTRESYEEYENWVFFEDIQGNPLPLEYDKVLVVQYYCRTMEQSEYNTTVINRTEYYLVPAPSESFQLPNTERASYDEMGIPRYQKEEFYTIIR